MIPPAPPSAAVAWKAIESVCLNFKVVYVEEEGVGGWGGGGKNSSQTAANPLSSRERMKSSSSGKQRGVVLLRDNLIIPLPSFFFFLFCLSRSFAVCRSYIKPRKQRLFVVLQTHEYSPLHQKFCRGCTRVALGIHSRSDYTEALLLLIILLPHIMKRISTF